MTISTTRSRFRTIGSATLAGAVGLGMGALAVATAAPASAAAIDKNISYTCVITDADANGDGSIDVPYLPITQPVVARTRVTIPDTVAKGETIPETPVLIDIDLSSVADTARTSFGTHVKGGSSNTQVHFGINGTDNAYTLQNLSAPWMVIPNNNPTGLEAPGTWVVPVAGTAPVVTVPDSASGTITVDGPSSFTIDAFHNSTGTDPHVGTSHLECTVINVDELRLGTIQVEGTDASKTTTLAATAAPSPVDKPATVNFAVTPATGTGTVALSYQGTEIGKATVAAGAASISIPATTFPKVGTYALQAEYSGDATHLGSKANVSVVRTAATLPPVVPAPIADAKINAKPKPKAFKVNKAAKLKIAIKSASTSLAGKIVVKVGSKTLGKGKTDDAGKATIKLKKIKKKYVKKGKIKLKVTYGGNATTEKAKKTVKVKVKG
ncbi:Ig-like domain repeat protein [Nocardioides seonyuensis]|uniref:Ig-like domain repeat protein n=1 Tax=Nocardioides seonyuensis TaxID=2518371 RepID=A0A4P7IGA4_9ACTN|nr:Ig-like domain-containing protein [Nocardioides seonyuensis]QBX55673.1 Ig-like domain repeat protein [Nocardioides seonyuensis]